MASLGRILRLALGAWALVLLVALAAPVQAQQPSSVNPTASSVKEQQLLQELNRIQGRVSIPDRAPACWSSRKGATGAVSAT